MTKRFNIAGMCREGEHYMLPPLRRVPSVRELVVFDRRKRVPWADKVFLEEVAGPGGQRVFVFGA